MARPVKGQYRVASQIATDRYYAAHLLGDFGDRRAVRSCVPVERSRRSAPSSRGLSRDWRTRAVGPLLDALDDDSPSMRVLVDLRARDAEGEGGAPPPERLAGRPPEIEFGAQVSVADAAKSRHRKAAVTSLASRPMVNLQKSLAGPVTSFALVAVLVASCAARPVADAVAAAGCRPTASARTSSPRRGRTSSRRRAAPGHLRRRAAGDSRCGHTPARLRRRRGVAGSGKLHAGTAGAAPRRARAGVCRVQHASRRRILEGTPRRGPDRLRRPDLAAAAGWQGICPTHDGYRRFRMDAFRKLLQDFAIDGVWLDYHHSHASWEQAEPEMPDTCFCDRCLRRFQDATAIRCLTCRRPSARPCSCPHTARPGSAGGGCVHGLGP